MGLQKTLSIILLSAITIVTILYISNPSCEENYKHFVEKYYKNIKPSVQSTQHFENNCPYQSRLDVKLAVREQYGVENKSKILNMIDHVLYINLPLRADRNKEVKNELDILGLPYTRIEGVVNKFGGLGCSMAHLKAIKYAKTNNFKNVLICEDDIHFKFNRGELHNNLVQALTYLGNDYDVLMLTGGRVKSYNIVNTKVVRQVETAQTRTAYLVNSTYYDTLIANFDDNVRELVSRGPRSYTGNVDDQQYGYGFAGDQYWKHLQPVDRWFIMKPRQCKQRKSFSDIQKITADYSDS